MRMDNARDFNSLAEPVNPSQIGTVEVHMRLDILEAGVSMCIGGA